MMLGQHSTRVPGKNVSKEKKTKKRKEKLTQALMQVGE
jgi:hypothetical protein